MNANDCKNILFWTREKLLKTLKHIPNKLLDIGHDFQYPKGEVCTSVRSISLSHDLCRVCMDNRCLLQ